MATRSKRLSRPPRFRFVAVWVGSKKAELAFAGRFCGLIVVGCLVAVLPVYREVLAWESAQTARVAQELLMRLGVDVVREGATLFRGNVPVLEVAANCSGISIAWLLLAAIVAYPASWWTRVVGFLVGFVLLLGMNLLRVVTLFWVGAHVPGSFALAHENYWPILSIIVTVSLLAVWLMWVQSRALGRI